MAGAVARRLDAGFFARSALDGARDLIGCVFLLDGVGGRIVETEAYREHDPCCHAFRGRTPRNSTLFGPPGFLYVYFVYGIHFCCTIVCEPEGAAAGVLLRALEPLQGLERMAARRGTSDPRLLCSGPGRLAQALGVGREHDGLTVQEGSASVYPREGAKPRVLATPRIGVGGDERPWRFVDADSRFLSRPLPRALRS